MSSSTFSAAHRLYVKSLYRRMLNDSLNWTKNRNVHDPRQLAAIFDKAEAELARNQHPDPVICEHFFVQYLTLLAFHAYLRLAPLFPGGTKWERNIPPPVGPLYDHLEADAHEVPAHTA
ncbi:hypothetical protein BT96DRAFT_984214 [Gymnopus androsaceus JB14]|uniref:NADH dehydrogenase [ubiquinone] 1 beta subcomplex subunit 9 n=1 Tax=Gymnopus androsaceus JB14 TaxID=1447944 RepID=A0A6A4IGX3_9AGAR|nr:hypothetical protein BT96DRAFT_984214 [Gymnopus androsaceus JB14]